MKFKIHFLVMTFLGFNLFSQSKINKDRNSILKMCGCFEVEFKFKETFQHIDDENYKPSKDYRSYALEFALPIINEKKKISIQHLLVVGYGKEKMIVKHWRQDWIYQNRDLYDYSTNNRWKYLNLPKIDVKGQWTQKVYQVDDSPRYEGTGTWLHVDGKSYWENVSNAPLPRRERTKRKDYNLMIRNNRHQITDHGWVHIQDNKKILKNDNETILLAEEKGINTYKKVSNKKCSLAESWWNENKDKWTSVRNTWEKIYDKKKNLQLNEKVDGMRLYEYLLFTTDYETKENHQSLINKFILD